MAREHVVGSILGTAVGDALGLPYEGLSRRRAVRLLGPPDRYRFFFGRGLVSDDAEHTCLVAQSLIASGCEVDSFRPQLAWRLRLWLLGLPAGIGLATLRAILRLWVGINPERSGVNSAGNGPAMRTAVIGATIDDPDRLRELVRASTRMTHIDPKAEQGALAIALAAQMARTCESISADVFLQELVAALAGEGAELLSLVGKVAKSVKDGETTTAFADSLGLANGVSGYILHSVPVALHAWLSNPRDYRAAVTSVIACGGDTDSTAAFVGGIVGAAVGKEGIPVEWLERLVDWPRSVSWMEQLGEQLEQAAETMQPSSPCRVSIAGIFLRNSLFLAIVLFHGSRRLLPPY